MSEAQRIGRNRGHFEVDVENLKRGPATFDCEIPLPWLAEELSACDYPVAPVRAHLEAIATLADTGVLIRGAATARVRTECGTCLAEVVLDLTAPLSAFVQPRGAAAEDPGAELTPEELEREWYDDGGFALDGMVRDGLVLELPMTPRCEGDCRGEAAAHLAPKEKRVDPRLAPLASIRLAKEK
jgi:uncharacterized metal-binding protein YceD (DUF177 family)